MQFLVQKNVKKYCMFTQKRNEFQNCVYVHMFHSNKNERLILYIDYCKIFNDNVIATFSSNPKKSERYIGFQRLNNLLDNYGCGNFIKFEVDLPSYYKYKDLNKFQNFSKEKFEIHNFDVFGLFDDFTKLDSIVNLVIDREREIFKDELYCIKKDYVFKCPTLDEYLSNMEEVKFQYQEETDCYKKEYFKDKIIFDI